jgi:ribA/ribD-fused uncharacterized protein
MSSNKQATTGKIKEKMMSVFSPRKTRATGSSSEPMAQHTPDDTTSTVSGGTDSDSAYVIEHATYREHMDQTGSELLTQNLFTNVPTSNTTSSDDRLANIEQLLHKLEPNISKLDPTINAIQTDIAEIKSDQSTQLNHITSKVEQIEQNFQSIKTENMLLKTENQALKQNIVLLNEKIDRQEAYSRKHNLLLHGVKEDQAPIITTVRRILGSMGIPEPNNIMIDDAHRLGQMSKTRNRPIIFRLILKSDRNLIWDARRNLKGSDIFISEDLPEVYQRQRNLLKPVLMAAKSSGKKAIFVANKLLIDGKLYSVEQMQDLPQELNPERGCIIENNNTICFFGRYTPLSNFHMCNFSLNGRTYNCIEQFLQTRKAEILGHEVAAQKILSAVDPIDQKQLARTIKDTQGEWKKVAKREVKQALTAKFAQNPELLQYLLNTGNKRLAEASSDYDWGTGLTLRNSHSLDKNQWQGKNWLGELLMVTRQELS